MDSRNIYHFLRFLFLPMRNWFHISCVKQSRVVIFTRIHLVLYHEIIIPHHVSLITRNFVELKMQANLDRARLRGGIRKKGCGKIASHRRRMALSYSHDRKYSAHPECQSSKARRESKGLRQQYAALDFHTRNSDEELCKRDANK